MNSFSKILNQEYLSAFGIVDFGYTEESLSKSFEKYDEWLSKNNHEPLGYLSGERGEKRADLKKFYPEFKSALTFLFSYYPTKRELESFYKSDQSNGLKIASYVLGFNGEDYHYEVRSHLEEISSRLQEIDPDLKVSLALDIQPVLDRDLAYKSGLGWYGKNSMFINKTHGSFTIIGSLLLSKEIDLESKKLDVDHCGQCRACIDACPTDAIDIETRTLISKKCISTYTIEVFKDDVMDPPEGMENGGGEIFGCDICQDVCPWNLRLERNLDKAKTLTPKPGSKLEKIMNFFLRRSKEELVEDLELLSNKKFRKEFSKTALERTGRVGLLKNILAYLK